MDKSACPSAVVTDATAGYERVDVNPRSVIGLFAGVMGMLVIVLGGLWLMLREFHAVAQQHDAQLAPVVDQNQLPPAPRLQSMPREDYQALLQAETTRLNSYGWTDEKKGMVHIPISRAMDLILERGLSIQEVPTGTKKDESAK